MGFMHLLFVLSYVPISISLTTGKICYDTGNFTTNSNYANNRKNILSSLATDVKSNNGFFTGSTGQGSDEVYALALCRGDFSSEKCASCINSTSQDIMTECPNQKEALDMSSGCIVRYANRSFSGKMELYPVVRYYNVANITSDMTQFGKIWQNLMDSLCKKASMSYSQFRFATGEANLTAFQTIYALMQCTPDLSQIDCDSCLRQYIANYTSCCYGKQGAGFQGPSCMFRWELYPFYNAAIQNNDTRINPLLPPPSIPTLPPPSMPTHSTTMPGKGGNNKTKIVIISVSSFAAIAAALLGFYCYSSSLQKKRQKELEGGIFATDEDHSEEMHFFSLTTIKAATNNFSNENKLGEGGFGPVYKGQLLNGTKIAVKRLSMRSSQAKAFYHMHGSSGMKAKD
ncbi:hypothetical protein LWI28_001967 [Acer negundo]|uniref:Cysteine-rich receptor-like protein kinase n=1 Tax=Acer negundo TaxID=4023 RepID=A0AAD5JNZ3_ACENE|nr:hypothetical protein LWI28_001967 [Acer negundo]